MSLFSDDARAMLSPAQLAFVDGVDASTDKVLTLYRSNPPALASAAEIEAYCCGFREATKAFATLHLVRNA